MRKYNSWVILSIIIVVGALNMVIQGRQKVDFHLDEQWSYGFANSYDRTFIGDHLFYQPLYPELFKNYVTVQAGEQFAYDVVYHNRSQAVHPPLFFHLLHTISSLFPDQFSKWHGLSLNISAYVLTLVVLFYTAQTILKSRTQALLATVLWAFSLGAINTVVFIRMYSLLALFTALLALWGFKFLEEKRPIYLPLLFITVFLGGLTHYYFFIFAFFLSASICLAFLLQKNWQALIMYSVAILAGLGAVVLVYPAMITHLTTGSRGTEAVSGLRSMTFNLEHLASILNININVFTGIQAHIPLWGVLALGVMGFAVGFKFRPRINPMLLILSGSVFASFYVLATIAPDMGIYRDRYFFSLFPLVSIGIIALGAWLVSVTDRRVAYGLVGVMAVALIHSSLVTESVYLFQDNRDFDRLINDHHVIFVTEEPFRIHEFASRYDQFTDVFPLHARDHEGVSYPDRILDYFGIFPIEHVRLVLVVDKAFPQIIGSEALQATFTARGYGLELIEPTAKTTYDVYRIVLLDT